MASPFAVFRKHQKLMLAILTILAMFGFVFLPIILQGMGMRQVKNPVVVSTEMFGDLKEYDLRQMVERRRAVVKFLRNVAAAVNQAEGSADAIEYVLGSFGREEEWLSDRSVVQTWLLARHAERQGVVISNQVINARLREWTEDRVGPYQLNTIISDMDLTQLQLFEMLREELMALRFQEMFAGSVRPDTATPGQRWDYFTRLKQQAEIEAVPVHVDDFVDTKEDPGDDVLRPFFEAHKERNPNPNDPTPGFREPKRIAVRYFKADYDKFTSPEMISDEGVLEEYEANKAFYDRMRRSSLIEPELGPELKEPEGTETTGKTDETGAPPEGAPSEGATPEKGETPPPAEPAPAQPEPPTGDTENPTEDEEAGGETEEPAAGAEEPAATGETPGDSDQGPAEGETSSRLRDRSGAGPYIRFAAYQEAEVEAAPPDGPESPDEAGTPEEPESADEGESPGAATPESPDGPELAPAAPGTPEPAETEPETAPAEAEPATPPAEAEREASSEAEEAEPATPPAEAEREASSEAEESEPAPEALPEETAGLVRRMLARKKIEETLSSLQDAIGDYRSQRDRYRAHKDTDKQVSPPKKPDYKALAEQYGVSTGFTPLVSMWEIQEYDVGRSRIGGRIPLYEYGYQRDWGEYLPETAVDLNNDHYLVWKIEESKGRVPEFTDKGVRERVLAQWRRIQARERARKRAEELAAEAREAGKPLVTLFADKPELSVVLPDPFSWRTQGLVPSDLRIPPRLSRVEGVGRAGEEFMRTVFSLGEGEIDVAANQPKSIFYVVRVAEFNPSADALWAIFTSEPYFNYVGVALIDRDRMFAAWADELKKMAGFKWEQPPRGEEPE